jgi:hypothetical protein
VITVRRADQHAAMPWANGRGVSYEIVREDDEHGQWRWRVAIAPITEDGPFSPLPGVHRELTLLEGDGLVLNVGGNMVGCRIGEVVRFAGAAHTHAALTSGSVVDLNVMSRDETPMTMTIEQGPTEVLAAACLVAVTPSTVTAVGTQYELQPRDALVAEGAALRLISGSAAVIRPMR